MESVLLKLVLVLSTFGLLMFFINKATRKWLNVEKKEFFSYGHVNETHKKIDWTIRIIFIVFIFIGTFTNVTRDPLKLIWFLQTHILTFVFIFATEIVRVIMEKRYAENKNDYLFTIIQLGFILIFTLLLFSTDFLGLLER